MSNNRYGLDVDYLRKRMERMIRDIDNYTQQEAFKELSDMAMVAATQASYDVEMKVKIAQPAQSQE